MFQSVLIFITTSAHKCWALIQSGVNKDIKIKSSSLYVKRTKYGYVLNSVFNLTSNFSSTHSAQPVAESNLLANPSTSCSAQPVAEGESPSNPPTSN